MPVIYHVSSEEEGTLSLLGTMHELLVGLPPAVPQSRSARTRQHFHFFYQNKYANSPRASSNCVHPLCAHLSPYTP